MYFGYKHVEIGLNCLHELAIIFKYQMPLRKMRLLLYQRTIINLLKMKKIDGLNTIVLIYSKNH